MPSIPSKLPRRVILDTRPGLAQAAAGALAWAAARFRHFLLALGAVGHAAVGERRGRRRGKGGQGEDRQDLEKLHSG